MDIVEMCVPRKDSLGGIVTLIVGEHIDHHYQKSDTLGPQLRFMDFVLCNQGLKSPHDLELLPSRSGGEGGKMTLNASAFRKNT
jgi:hypothetical protein